LMRPLRQIAKDLRLDRPIALALVEGQGVLGTLLSTVTALREERAPQAEQRIGGVTFRDRDWLVLEERASMENAVP
ncbi:MAG TPA: hypothetical protein VKA48_13230, partial [Gammaproteobacteria bacterium]|nr:hypothetical protein [Gammaproteobacteria bacterium]